jgi:catechol 2,3-dioxygenase-like lactoylglutathione lyase family enzyme
VLQHVSLEVPAAEGEACARFWALLGFARVEAPAEVAEYVIWVERGGTQIHLILTEPAYTTVPKLGHPAVVVEDFDRALSKLAETGHEVSESRPLWGARRAFAVDPAGHRVELMEEPPPPSA